MNWGALAELAAGLLEYAADAGLAAVVAYAVALVAILLGPLDRESAARWLD